MKERLFVAIWLVTSVVLLFGLVAMKGEAPDAFAAQPAPYAEEIYDDYDDSLTTVSTPTQVITLDDADEAVDPDE